MGKLRLLCFALIAWCVVGACPALAAETASPELYVVDVSNADLAVRLQVASLQGLLNRSAELRAKLAQAGAFVIRYPADEMWLNLYLHRQPSKVTPLTPDGFLAKLKPQLQGQVIYDPAQPWSIGIATTFAGLESAVMTSSDLGLKTVEDLRGRWPDRASAYRWAVDQLRPRCTSVALFDSASADLRDYLIAQSAFVCDLDPLNNPTEIALLKEIMGGLPAGQVILGPTSAKFADTAKGQTVRDLDRAVIALTAANGLYYVPADGATNLSFHSQLKPSLPSFQRKHYLEPVSGQTYVTFVFVGGEDLGFDLGPLRHLFEDPARGKVPLGWTISPTLFARAPGAAQFYLAGARRGTDPLIPNATDQLVMAPNGPGMTLPSAHAGVERSVYATALANAAKADELPVVMIYDNSSAEAVTRMFEQLAAGGATTLTTRGVKGALAVSGTPVATGLIKGMPVVTEAHRATGVSEALDALRNLDPKANFAFVGVDPSRLDPSGVKDIADRLGSRQTVVAPWEFLELYREWSGLKAAGIKKFGKAKGITISQPQLDPAVPAPGFPVKVTAQVTGAAALDSVKAIYKDEFGAVFVEDMQQSEGDTFTATLPPFLHGGDASVKVRATNRDMEIAWSPVTEFKVPYVDNDSDRLTDAEEPYAATDPRNPDSDGDGWRDGNDKQPIVPDKWINQYLYVIRPPADVTFISEDHGSKLTDNQRTAEGDSYWIYRLPLSGVPRPMPACLQMRIGNNFLVSVSKDGKEWQEAFRAKQPTSDLSNTALQRWDLPSDWLKEPALLVKVAALPVLDGLQNPPGATAFETALTSLPEAPSVLLPTVHPAQPAPGRDTVVTAVAYSPDKVSTAVLHYKINQGAWTIAKAEEVTGTQVYAAKLPELDNGDMVTCWLAVFDEKQRVSATTPIAFPVGIDSAETITLLARRDFEGDWLPAAEWEDSARWAPKNHATDTSKFSISPRGGRYAIWILCAPRGHAIAVDIDGTRVGTVDAKAADGWQKLTALEIPRKDDYKLKVVSLPTPGAEPPKDAPALAPIYAEVIITADGRFRPPANLPIDFYNTMTVLSPKDGDEVSGMVTIRVTTTANVNLVECLVGVNEQSLGTQYTPPCEFRWQTGGLRPGQYPIKLRGYNRAKEVMFETTIKVKVKP